MNFVRASVSRHFLKPSLRMMRDSLGAGTDYRAIRAMSARFDAMLAEDPGELRTEIVALPECSATWMTVKGARRDRVILYVHGGAFIAETPASHTALLARMCRGTRARGLMVNYRLAPEHPYPAAPDDCLAAYRFLLETGQDPARIVIAGDSAGGNLALVTLLRARDAGLPLPAAAVVLSPVTDVTMSGDSIRRNDGHDPMFTAATFAALAPLYLPREEDRKDPYASPLFGDLTDLPPVLLIVGSSELLLDDSVRFACKCPSATLTVWHDMPHVFAAFPFLPEANDAVTRISAFVNDRFAAAPAGIDVEGPVPDDVPGADETSNRIAPVAPTRATRVPGIGAVYLTLAILGAVLAIAVALPPFVVPGTAPPGLVLGLARGTAPPLDALVAGAALLLFIVAEGVRLGMSRLWLPVAATIVFGVACGLPLFLFLRQRRRRSK